MKRTLSLALPLLLLGGCDPSLTLDTIGVHLVVGQTGHIRVIEGASDATMLPDTLTLTDTGGQAFDATALAAKAISEDTIELVVPTGIAPGRADLRVDTSEGFPFAGKLQITRLAAMRDLAGTVWMIALPEAGTMNQYLDIAPGTKGMGKGAGAVAISPDGKLLASSARAIWRVYLSWTGDHPMQNFVQLSREVVALSVTSTHHTLAATDKGVHVISPPTKRTEPLVLSKTALATGNTLALASARNAKVAVALSHGSGSGANYKLYSLSLAGAAPAVATQDDISWALQAGNKFSVALTHDGNSALVTNMAGHRVNLLRKGSNTSLALPTGQRGPVSVAAGAGGVFYVLNETTKNISVIKISGNSLKAESAIDLGLTAAAGKPLQLSMSGNGELVVLAEREVVLVYPKTGSASAMQFANLFSDKTKGEVGASIAIQP